MTEKELYEQWKSTHQDVTHPNNPTPAEWYVRNYVEVKLLPHTTWLSRVCDKCGAPFENHHHRHITRQGIFHTSCYNSYCQNSNLTMPEHTPEWEVEFDRKFPIMSQVSHDEVGGTFVIEADRKAVKSFIRTLLANAKQEELERLKDEALKQYGLGQQEGIEYAHQSLLVEIEEWARENATKVEPEEHECHLSCCGKCHCGQEDWLIKFSDILKIISKE